MFTWNTFFFEQTRRQVEIQQSLKHWELHYGDSFPGTNPSKISSRLLGSLGAALIRWGSWMKASGRGLLP